MNQKKLSSLYPSYSIVLLAAMVSMNMLAYYGARLFNSGRYHYNIESPLDQMLPLVPFFVVFYVLAFAQWIGCYLLMGLEDKEFCLRFFLGEIIAKIFCMIIFFVFPTTLNRPEITGSGIFERLLAFIYSTDVPDNLFPSIHCLESWMCFRGCRKLTMTRLPGWFSVFNLVFTLCVFASTVLCKQHVLIDIAGGVAAVEAGLFLSGKLLAARNRRA